MLWPLLANKQDTNENPLAAAWRKLPLNHRLHASTTLSPPASRRTMLRANPSVQAGARWALTAAKPSHTADESPPVSPSTPQTSFTPATKWRRLPPARRAQWPMAPGEPILQLAADSLPPQRLLPASSAMVARGRDPQPLSPRGPPPTPAPPPYARQLLRRIPSDCVGALGLTKLSR